MYGGGWELIQFWEEASLSPYQYPWRRKLQCASSGVLSCLGLLHGIGAVGGPPKNPLAGILHGPPQSAGIFAYHDRIDGEIISLTPSTGLLVWRAFIPTC